MISKKKALINEKKSQSKIIEPEEDPSILMTKSRIEIPEDIFE
jgi:hypothetical protein